jgi:hypothetical protein
MLGKSKQLGEKATARKGMYTGKNARFVRIWYEVSANSISFSQLQRPKWFPYANGGGYRKWYGCVEDVVDWQDNGASLRSFKDQDGSPRAGAFNLDYIFKEGVFWTAISNYNFCARILPKYHLFSSAANAMFGDGLDTNVLLGILNSKVATLCLKAINPTLNYNAGDIEKVALPELADEELEEVRNVIEKVLKIAHTDWDAFETSLDFLNQPLLSPGLKGLLLEASWRNWESQCSDAIRRMQELETENNRLFITAYGLEGEVQPEVPEDQITLARAEPRKDLAAFLSYATGCLMGRYSLDQPGLRNLWTNGS